MTVTHDIVQRSLTDVRSAGELKVSFFAAKEGSEPLFMGEEEAIQGMVLPNVCEKDKVGKGKVGEKDEAEVVDCTTKVWEDTGRVCTDGVAPGRMCVHHCAIFTAGIEREKRCCRKVRHCRAASTSRA
jgi:hypothetical protein